MILPAVARYGHDYRNRIQSLLQILWARVVAALYQGAAALPGLLEAQPHQREDGMTLIRHEPSDTPVVQPCCGLRHPLPWDHGYRDEETKPARKRPLRYWLGLDGKTCICGHHDRAHGPMGCEGVDDEGQWCLCLNEGAKR